MKPTAEVVQTSPAVEVVEVPTPVIFEPVETPKPWTHEEVAALAKMLWGEARGVPSETEQAACVWCVLNRVDQGYGSILEVVTAPSQFVGYRENNPIDETLWLLSEDVLTRWQREKDGETEVGRVLPPDYLFQVTATTIISAMLTVEETLGIGNMSPRMKAEVHL